MVHLTRLIVHAKRPTACRHVGNVATKAGRRRSKARALSPAQLTQATHAHASNGALHPCKIPKQRARRSLRTARHECIPRTNALKSKSETWQLEVLRQRRHANGPASSYLGWIKCSVGDQSVPTSDQVRAEPRRIKVSSTICTHPIKITAPPVLFPLTSVPERIMPCHAICVMLRNPQGTTRHVMRAQRKRAFECRRPPPRAVHHTAIACAAVSTTLPATHARRRMPRAQ